MMQCCPTTSKSHYYRDEIKCNEYNNNHRNVIKDKLQCSPTTCNNQNNRDEIKCYKYNYRDDVMLSYNK